MVKMKANPHQEPSGSEASTMRSTKCFRLLLVLSAVAGLLSCQTPKSRKDGASTVKSDELEDCSVYVLPARRKQCEQRNAARLAAQGNADILLVVVGGWKSCVGLGQNRRTPTGMFLDAQFNMLLQNLKSAGIKTKYIKGCFGFGNPMQGTVTVVSSGGREGTFHPNHLARFIRDDRPAGAKLFMIGHSYGGWMVLKAATELGQSIDGLYSLEPISGDLCLQQDNMPITGGQNPECRVSPSTHSVNPQTILSRTGNWINFHLDPSQNNGPVHATPYGLAGMRDISLAITGGEGPFFSGHHLLGFSFKAWQPLCQNIMQRLDKTGPCTPYQQLDNRGKPK